MKSEFLQDNGFINLLQAKNPTLRFVELIQTCVKEPDVHRAAQELSYHFFEDTAAARTDISDLDLLRTKDYSQYMRNQCEKIANYLE